MIGAHIPNHQLLPCPSLELIGVVLELVRNIGCPRQLLADFITIKPFIEHSRSHERLAIRVRVQSMVQVRIVHNDFTLLDTPIIVDLVPSNTLPSFQHEQVSLGIDHNASGSAQIAQDRGRTPPVGDFEREGGSGTAIAREGGGEGRGGGEEGENREGGQGSGDHGPSV